MSKEKTLSNFKGFAISFAGWYVLSAAVHIPLWLLEERLGEGAMCLMPLYLMLLPATPVGIILLFLLRRKLAFGHWLAMGVLVAYTTNILGWYALYRPEALTGFFGSPFFMPIVSEVVDPHHEKDDTEDPGLDVANAHRYFTKGLTSHYHGDYEQAIVYFTQAIELTPDDGTIYYNRGRAYAAQGDYEQAIADFDKVIDLVDAAWVNAAYRKRGLAYLNSGDDEQAIADFTRSTELAPQTAETYSILCWDVSLAGHASYVMDACERAVELDPHNGWSHDRRGLARALVGDYDGAIEDFNFFVEWAKENGYERYGAKREAWIADLEVGRNPFDEATLEELQTR